MGERRKSEKEGSPNKQKSRKGRKSENVGNQKKQEIKKVGIWEK